MGPPGPVWARHLWAAVGPYEAGPYGPGPYVAPMGPCGPGPYGPGPHGPPWALMGRALMGLALSEKKTTCTKGPHGLDMYHAWLQTPNTPYIPIRLPP